MAKFIKRIREENKMKEFRVAKCMENGEVREYAIFADGSEKKLIQTDEQYGKYFEVDNELNPNQKPYMRTIFTDRIKDAVDTIRNGDGDCIKIFSFLAKSLKVGYFLDRKIGEDIRQKFLNEWENTKFGYTIKIGHKKSAFGNCTMLNKNGQLIMPFDSDKTPMNFETEESATDYVENVLLTNAKYYAKKLDRMLLDVTDLNEKLKIIRETLNEISEKYGPSNIISDFTFDMLDDNCELISEECELNNMSYKIVQYVVE